MTGRDREGGRERQNREFSAKRQVEGGAELRDLSEDLFALLVRSGRQAFAKIEYQFTPCTVVLGGVRITKNKSVPCVAVSQGTPFVHPAVTRQTANAFEGISHTHPGRFAVLPVQDLHQGVGASSARPTSPDVVWQPKVFVDFESVP